VEKTTLVKGELLLRENQNFLWHHLTHYGFQATSTAVRKPGTRMSLLFTGSTPRPNSSRVTTPSSGSLPSSPKMQSV